MTQHNYQPHFSVSFFFPQQKFIHWRCTAHEIPPAADPSPSVPVDSYMHGPV